MFDINKLLQVQTPYYYYDIDLLKQTVYTAKAEADKRSYKLHYALKANSNPKLLKIISDAGFGADCVSGNEVLRAIECGFKPNEIEFAGVGKTDREIQIGLDNNIFCFNCESVEEIEVLNQAAANCGKTVNISIRVNPNVDGKTHAKVNTGLAETKFGIPFEMFDYVADFIKQQKNVNLNTLHFHVGSQITDLDVFKNLSFKVNNTNKIFADKGFNIKHVDVGGGLGVDYYNPDDNLIPDFASYFSVFEKHIQLFAGQTLHLEPGRSIVAQCGSLISTVVFVKKGAGKEFIILDSGMAQLIRPALYGSYHKIENLSSQLPHKIYDVVGPFCESSDVFGTSLSVAETKRGDLVIIRSAGAYGEVMSSNYNLHELPGKVYSDEL